MTVQTTSRVAGPYIGTGLVGSFPFTFKVFVNTDVLVVVNTAGLQTTLNITTDYTVALNADQDNTPGGSVILAGGFAGTLLAIGTTLTISSQVPQLQKTNLINFGGFNASVITAALDYLTILVQQLSNSFGRAITIPLSDGVGINTQLPGAAARALLLVGCDIGGNFIMTTGTIGPQGPQGVPGSTFAGVNLNYYALYGGV